MVDPKPAPLDCRPTVPGRPLPCTLERLEKSVLNNPKTVDPFPGSARKTDLTMLKSHRTPHQGTGYSNLITCVLFLHGEHTYF